MKRLKLDDEALRLLSYVDMTIDDVPSEGQVVRLRSVANVNAGSVPVAAFADVHPDNRRLAKEIAEAVRLDLIGIDLLISDIASSWHEVDAVVCEVNHDPQIADMMPQHLFDEILENFCGGTGRIPTTVIIGAMRASEIAAHIAETMARDGRQVGIAKEAEVLVAGTVVTRRAQDVFTGAQMLLSHRDVDIAIVAIEKDDVLETSLPIDRIDVLVIVGPIDGSRANALARLTRMLSPNSTKIIVDDEIETCRDAVVPIDKAKLRCLTGGDAPIAAATCAALEEAHSRHAKPSGWPSEPTRP